MTLLADLAALVRELLPESCVRCDEPSSTGFCASCRSEFVRVPSPCPRCALPCGDGACPAQRDSWSVDAVRAPFAFGPPLAAFVRALKYAGKRRLGPPLGQLLASELAGIAVECDAVAAVPLHPARLRHRTYNQAREIAGPAATALGLPLLASGLARRRNTVPQTELAGSERRRNLAEAFAAGRHFSGRRIAIVDDVVTTGATVNAVAAALKAAGAVRVEAWAVARTSWPDQDARNR